MPGRNKRQISSDEDDPEVSPAGSSISKRLKTQETTDRRDEGAKIRIEPEYLTVIPDLIHSVPSAPARDVKPENVTVQMCAPTENNTSDKKLDEYIMLAGEKYGCNRELALNVLFWNRYSYRKAIADLPIVEYILKNTDESGRWTPKDNKLYNISYRSFIKKFWNQKNVMLHKSTQTSLKHYLWKHNKHMNNVIDSQVQEEPHDKVSETSVASVAKYYYMWKNNIKKGKRRCFIDQ